MGDPFSNQIQWRDQPPPRSPETIPVNLPRSNKVKPVAGSSTTPSSSGSSFDPALLNSNLQELDAAVAKLEANSIQLTATRPPQKAQHSRRQRSVAAADGGISIYNSNDNASQCFSEFDQVQFQDDTTKYVIDNMERIAVGVAFPSPSKASSRRSRSSRSSLKKKRISLEQLVSETILREQGQYFSTTDDEDDIQSSCTTTTSAFDILKDLRQMNQVIASETGTIAESIHGGTDRNSNRSRHSPPAPTHNTIVHKIAPTEATDDRKPTASNNFHAKNLLPHIDTEDEEPSLLPTTEEWTPDWNAAKQLESSTVRDRLPSPPSANKSGCTDDTDPETINTSGNEKSLQSSQKSFFGEHIDFAEWPTAECHPSVGAVVDEWTTFDTTNVFSDANHSVNENLRAKSSTETFFDPLSLDSPSSIMEWDAHQQPTKMLLSSKWEDEYDGPW